MAVAKSEIGNTKFEIDGSTLPSSAYLVKLATAKGIVSRRLLVE